MNESTGTKIFPYHTLGKSFLLHISPGILVAAAFLVLKSPLDSMGYPPLLAFLLAVVLIDIPFMLCMMLYEGKKLHRRFTMEGVVLYRDKVSWKTFVLVFVGAFVILYLLIMLVGSVDAWVTENLFSWTPDWLFMGDPEAYERYAKGALVFVFSLHLLITGILLPWVEELYFRGFLMPRLSRFEKWAPLLGGLFFGLYHAWQLFGFVGIFLVGTGLGYVVWWKKDIRLSISLHVFANTMLRGILLIGILAM